MRFRVDGADGAAPLLMINSLGADLTMWEPQVPILAGRHRIIRYDARGHGLSPVPEGRYALADLGRDALALLDRLGIASADVCGLSLGGMTAMWLAAHAPSRVNRVEDMDLRADLGRIVAPTMVIAGADDVATPPSHGAAIADAIPGARLEVLADAAHLATFQQADKANRLILEALDE